MRKLLIGSLLVASAGGGVVFSGAAMSGAEPTCAPGGQGAGPVSVGGNVTPDGSGYVQVCTSGTGVADGTTTAAGSAASQNGYVVADGNSTNPGALAGYIGVSSNDGGVVGCSSGDFNNESYGSTAPAASGDKDATDQSGNPVEDSTDNDGNNVLAPTPGLSQSGISGYPAQLQALAQSEAATAQNDLAALSGGNPPPAGPCDPSAPAPPAS